ncbi:MAG: hypothetical protein ACRDPW_08230 [Mycobacteriales bacterium]
MSSFAALRARLTSRLPRGDGGSIIALITVFVVVVVTSSWG